MIASQSKWNLVLCFKCDFDLTLLFNVLIRYAYELIIQLSRSQFVWLRFKLKYMRCLGQWQGEKKDLFPFLNNFF